MVMMASAFLDENPSPTDEEIREALVGNLCRCTGYNRIVRAVLAASSQETGV
jgi:carbon-monoxide dehydrogenase small subunit